MRTEKLKIGIQAEFNIVIDDMKGVKLIYQKDKIPFEYKLCFIQEFDINDNGLIDPDDVEDVVDEVCSNYLESLNIDYILEGLNYTIELVSLTTHTIH